MPPPGLWFEDGDAEPHPGRLAPLRHWSELALPVGEVRGVLGRAHSKPRPQAFHLLKMFCFVFLPPVGFKGNLSLLEICFVYFVQEA